MADIGVRRELLARLKCSRQALSQRAKRLKDKYGPMSTDEAVYVIAHMEGIDLSKYLSLESLDRIRSLVPREITARAVTTPRRTVRGKPRQARATVAAYPLVRSVDIRRALAIGAESFPQVVVLENSMRNLIEQTLSSVRADWWIVLVPPGVQRSVQRIIDKEKRFPYREKRGDKPLMYCNFDDLKEIVLANQVLFSKAVFDFQWFETRMDEVYMARNNLAHSILLSEDDVTRIALFYRDWARVLESALKAKP